MPNVELSGHELSLLPAALTYSKELGKVPTQEELRTKLSCRSVNAKNLQKYLLETEALKLAERTEAVPERAETLNTVKMALGEQGQESAYGYMVRQNNLLQAQVARLKAKGQAEKEQRNAEIRQEIEELKELAKEEIQRKPQAVTKPKKDTGLMLEISTPDLHAGKLAHSLETGGRPYDVSIAIATFNRAIDVLLERTKNWEFSEILLCIGNDLCNSDNPEGTTTSGTSVSNDGRFYKTFTRVRSMLVDTIKRLREIAKVRVIVTGGNHDLVTSFHMGDSLECFFASDPQVTIENAPISRKYVEFGKCLIGFCHGHEEKHEDLGLLMASEQPAAWARTSFREWHLGHFHKLQTREMHGVRTRVLPALCSADSWHAVKGYVGNLRTAQAFVWSRTEGLICEVFYTDDAYPEIITKKEIV
jgi:hypothetical protein